MSVDDVFTCFKAKTKSKIFSEHTIGTSTPLERARKKTSLSVFYCGKRRNDKRQMRLKEEDPASPKIVAAANPVT